MLIHRLDCMHGEQAPVTDVQQEVQHPVQAAQALQSLGVALTLELLPGLGHGIEARVVTVVNERLRSAPV